MVPPSFWIMGSYSTFTGSTFAKSSPAACVCTPQTFQQTETMHKPMQPVLT